MLQLLLLAEFSCSSSPPLSDSGLAARLNASLDAGIGAFATSRTMGAWVGVATPTLRFGYGGGFSDINKRVPATPLDIIPAGSLTKSFTSAYIMHLVDDGELDLDSRVAPLVDGFLNRTMNTTLEELWGPAGHQIQNITLGQLLSMRSGVQDYDDDLLWNITMMHPERDMSPFDLINLTKKTFVCEPGSCGYYSSINYILAGFVLAQHTDAKDWADLDQRAFMSPELQERYKSIVFAGKGLCAKYADKHMTHTYAMNPVPTGKDPPANFSYVDMYNTSCLNGWTCGNMAISAKDAASYYFDLLAPIGPGPPLVSGWSRLQMVQMQPLAKFSWGGTHTHYGFGVFGLPIFEECPKAQAGAPIPKQCRSTMRQFIGHGGSDYGSYIIAGYHPSLNIAFAVGINKDYGTHHDDIDLAFCMGYQSVLKEAANFSITCPPAPATRAASGLGGGASRLQRAASGGGRRSRRSL